MALFPTTVLLATDGSEEARAAQAAIEVSNRTGSELHVPPPGRPAASLLSPLSRCDVGGFHVFTEATGELEKQGRNLLDEQVGKMGQTGDTVAEAHLRMGRPVDDLLAKIEEIGTGLVVVGSRDHSGIQRLVLDSVSEAVVRYARCSVKVVRGEDWHYE